MLIRRNIRRSKNMLDKHAFLLYSEPMFDLADKPKQGMFPMMDGAVVGQLYPELMVRGTIPSPLVAIIGTRQPSSEAAEAAFTVAKLLARAGIGVVSGLALGIDAAAHRGCLAGGGRTVAVLGHGLDAPLYPPQHTALAETIAQRGALVSPFFAQTPTSRQTLLARNAWIARLATAVWVVQTGVPGGALAAAAHARQLGIPVFTTPWQDAHWALGYQALVSRDAEMVDVLTVINRLKGCCTSEASPRAQQGVLAL
jgi:DNA protecting protein DprA